ncbi:MAG: cytochrome c oxidase subunit II [Acidobacteriota bacterium]|jgi:cytochrome c oxidase subunit 2
MDVASPLLPATPQAEEIARLFYVDLVIAGVIFVVVAGLVATVIIRNRKRSPDDLPVQNFGSETLEWTWTIIPVMIVTGLFVYTMKVMHEVDPKPVGREADVEIIAHQWWWEVHYHPSGAVTANEIHLPVGRDLLFQVRSADVIHDFWVPALGQKVDAIPNHPNYAWYDVDKPGTYLGTCAEFCGAEHAWMRIRVIAQPVPAFGFWVEEQLLDARPPTGSAAKAGAALFAKHTCMNCHSIRGTPANGDIGPDLTHLASRQTLAAGVFRNTPENLMKWVSDPQKYKPGSHMPTMDLRRQSFENIVAYLEELK